jgi:hypothetical protein
VHRVEIYGEQGQHEDQELVTRFAALDGVCQDVVTATVMHRASMDRSAHKEFIQRSMIRGEVRATVCYLLV